MVPPSDSLDKEHLLLLLQASEILASSLDIQQVLDRLMDQVIEVVGAERGFILLRSAQTGAWEFRAARALDSEALRGEDFRVSRSVVDQVVREGRSVLTSDALQDHRFREETSVGLHQMKSILCVPLVVEGQTLGVAYADHFIRTGVFRLRDQALMEAIARHASIALEKARLYARLQRVHEEAMEEARRELAETQARLVQASKMAAVGQLAAGLAHELNTPLGAIGLNLAALKQPTGEEIRSKRLDLLERAFARCRDIVRGVLDFSRLSGGERVATDLGEVLREALDLAGPDFDRHGIALTGRVEDGLKVNANPAEFSQLMLSLLSNARDAVAGLQAPRVEVRATRRGDRIAVEVSDNGPGISEQDKERIFEPFYTTKEVGQGVGLGLAICYQIASSHGADIEVESRAPSGTTFRLSLPALP